MWQAPPEAKDLDEIHATQAMFGELLGQTICTAKGDKVLARVEEIRQLSKSFRRGESESREQLITLLHSLDADELHQIARAFTQFLNLANIVEQFYAAQRENNGNEQLSSFTGLLERFDERGLTEEQIFQALHQLNIDLVLTAHPTEITRRSLIEKQLRINKCLEQLGTVSDNPRRQQLLREELAQLITEWWFTDEMRGQKPTPLDEAKWVFAVVEKSLWQAAPQFLRDLDRTVKQRFNKSMPLEFSPLRFTSWIGGDRDGNPFVTADMTRQVLNEARRRAALLFRTDLVALISELSMSDASEDFIQQAGTEFEPYRAVLRPLVQKLTNTIVQHEHWMNNRDTPVLDTIESDADLWEPLHQCYRSLIESNLNSIAEGSLRNTMYRVQSFGVYLMKMDIRQESDRHTEVIAEITRFYGLGDYSSWSEEDKISFLTRELASKRPLLPNEWEPSENVQEVINCFEMIAQQPDNLISAYVISMSRAASDILAVQLLMQATGCKNIIPISPLFETLDDLNNAPGIITELLNIPAYRNYCNGQQMVMIGYSDSSKDAGVMAASWAQYRAQEALIDCCNAQSVELTLFHGRGGTVGRGGVPAHAALLSQPPGSLLNGLRVTEQGEMIRFKLGMPETAETSLRIYAGAILESNLCPPPAPEDKWREIMDQLSALSSDAYRGLLRGEPEFMDYFNQATPIRELANLPLGSRPSKRRSDGGIESLRAIPWIFSWSQTRLMLPAWLGAGQALADVISSGNKSDLEAMSKAWPFFSSRLSMLEMVYSKADLDLAALYDDRLVDPSIQSLGAKIRQQLASDIETLTSIANEETLMTDLPWVKESVQLRNTYTDPLNLVQIELLQRNREQESDNLKKALMVTIAGIAAGLRNTG